MNNHPGCVNADRDPMKGLHIVFCASSPCLMNIWQRLDVVVGVGGKYLLLLRIDKTGHVRWNGSPGCMFNQGSVGLT